jgi:hypothetical protein
MVIYHPSMLGNGGLLAALALWLLGIIVFYWAIRMAIYHALRDTDRRRDREHLRAKEHLSDFTEEAED